MSFITLLLNNIALIQNTLRKPLTYVVSLLNMNLVFL